MRVGEQRVDRLGAGVERRRLELVLSERLLEVALLDTDDRRRVGDVREVAEPHRDRRRVRSAPGGLARLAAVTAGGESREHARDRR